MATENYRILDERDLNELEKEDKSLKEGILKNEKSINDIKEDVVELQGNVSNMSESIREIKTDVTNIENNITNIENNITDIEGDVDEIENRINNINDEVDIIVTAEATATPLLSGAQPTADVNKDTSNPGHLKFIFGIPSGAAGEQGVGIAGIKFLSSSAGAGVSAGYAGATDTYTITYTNGTTSTFTVCNGKNGINGTDATSIYYDVESKIIKPSDIYYGKNSEAGKRLTGFDFLVEDDDVNFFENISFFALSVIKPWTISTSDGSTINRTMVQQVIPIPRDIFKSLVNDEDDNEDSGHNFIPYIIETKSISVGDSVVDIPGFFMADAVAYIRLVKKIETVGTETVERKYLRFQNTSVLYFEDNLDLNPEDFPFEILISRLKKV